MSKLKKDKIRCSWSTSHELFIPYHDKEWGVPVHSDKKLFELLCLEGAQAGLSWLTILKKRPSYRKAFDNFDFNKVSKYDSKKRERLLKDDGIVRNKLKVNAFIENAKALIQIRKEFGTFDKYIWTFVNGKPIQSGKQPVKTTISEVMSKDLKKRGFKFVGPTVCYAFMQAAGLVNDHTAQCFRARELKG
ncbi:MAG: DNA-3-methyladenine glycosylase I [Bdellovibrionales bacterium]|nr:DNA-3-methyladenine glycosylase I [Bdellovibrionales bacterium]